jgi:signal transduction histidine kinase
MQRDVQPAAQPVAKPGRKFASDPEAIIRDEQTLLAGAVQRLRDTTGCDLAAAWALRADGTPYVSAAVFEGPPPMTPDRQAFDAAAGLSQATELVPGKAPRALTRRLAGYRSAAAAPVACGDGAVGAVLLLAVQEARSLRPRTLGTLESAVRRLAGPLAAAQAARRLAELDAELRRLDRLSTLGSLAAEIAHEVRNPLVSVKTFLQLLPERRDDPEFATAFLGVASEELQRVERLLDLVIEYPRGRHAEKASASPAEALESVSELLQHLSHAKGVRIESEAAPGLPNVAVGEDALRQLLLNLALNAVAVTPDGGRVQLVARGMGLGVELCVTDEGPGVPEEERTRVFELFHSTRPGSHGGLGLAISRRIAEEAGGHIAIEDAPAGGALFLVRLPVAAEE